jgi:colicin import membrane protein
MNKVYFLFPIIGLLVFGGYWFSFSIEYSKKIEAQKISEVRAREEKAHQDQINREKAVRDATDANNARIRQRDAKKAKEKKEKDDREAAIELKNKARGEMFKLLSQAERLSKDVTALKEENSKIGENIDRIKKEYEFLKIYVQKAEDNVKLISVVTPKIEKADDTIKKNAKDLAAALKAKRS